MGGRVAVSSMATRLCLLYLLEAWLASPLAFAATLDKPPTGKDDVEAGSPAIRGLSQTLRKVDPKEVSGTYVFPDNGTIKMTVRDPEGRISFHLKGCFFVAGNPKANRYTVMSVEEGKIETHIGSSEEGETIKGGKFTITLHRKRNVMQVFIDGYPKGSTRPLFKKRWDGSCEFSGFTVRDDRGYLKEGSEMELYKTENITMRA